MVQGYQGRPPPQGTVLSSKRQPLARDVDRGRLHTTAPVLVTNRRPQDGAHSGCSAARYAAGEVRPDTFLRHRTQNRAPSLCPGANTRDMQSPGPHVQSDHGPHRLLVIPIYPAVSATLHTCHIELRASAHRRARPRKRGHYHKCGWRASEGVARRPPEEHQDRVGAEERNQGEHRAPAHDWQLCRAAARHGSTGQGSKHPDERENGEEAQQSGAVLINVGIGMDEWSLSLIHALETTHVRKGRHVCQASGTSARENKLLYRTLAAHLD